MKKSNNINQPHIPQFNMKPNQLRVTVTDVNAKEVSIIVDLSGLESIANSQGEDAVKATIFKMFKDTIERIKNPPR